MKRAKPKDNHTCKTSLYIYVQLDDYNTYLTSLNDIIMLYKDKNNLYTGSPGSVPA